MMKSMLFGGYKNPVYFGEWDFFLLPKAVINNRNYNNINEKICAY